MQLNSGYSNDDQDVSYRVLCSFIKSRKKIGIRKMQVEGEGGKWKKAFVFRRKKERGFP